MLWFSERTKKDIKGIIIFTADSKHWSVTRPNAALKIKPRMYTDISNTYWHTARKGHFERVGVKWAAIITSPLTDPGKQGIQKSVIVVYNACQKHQSSLLTPTSIKIYHTFDTNVKQEYRPQMTRAAYSCITSRDSNMLNAQISPIMFRSSTSTLSL